MRTGWCLSLRSHLIFSALPKSTPSLKMQADQTDLEAGTRLAVWKPRNYFLLEGLFDLLADSRKVHCLITPFLLRRDLKSTIQVDLRS
jgi:hypothetical protein